VKHELLITVRWFWPEGYISAWRMWRWRSLSLI